MPVQVEEAAELSSAEGPAGAARWEADPAEEEALPAEDQVAVPWEEEAVVVWRSGISPRSP